MRPLLPIRPRFYSSYSILFNRFYDWYVFVYTLSQSLITPGVPWSIVLIAQPYQMPVAK